MRDRILLRKDYERLVLSSRSVLGFRIPLVHPRQEQYGTPYTLVPATMAGRCLAGGWRWYDGALGDEDAALVCTVEDLRGPEIDPAIPKRR